MQCIPLHKKQRHMLLLYTVTTLNEDKRKRGWSAQGHFIKKGKGPPHLHLLWRKPATSVVGDPSSFVLFEKNHQIEVPVSRCFIHSPKLFICHVNWDDEWDWERPGLWIGIAPLQAGDTGTAGRLHSSRHRLMQCTPCWSFINSVLQLASEHEDEVFPRLHLWYILLGCLGIPPKKQTLWCALVRCAPL